MLLKNISDTQITYLRYTMEKDQSAISFMEDLSHGIEKIYCSVDEENHTIQYEATCEDTMVGISVGLSRNIVNRFDDSQDSEHGSLGPKECAIAYYIHQIESAESENELTARYGQFYPLFAKFSQFSPSQLANYYQDLDELKSLIYELDKEPNIVAVDTKQSGIHPEVQIEIECDPRYRDTYAIRFSILAGGKTKGIRVLELQELAMGRGSFTLSSSGSTRAAQITLDDFDSEQKQLLSFITIFCSSSEAHTNRSTRYISLSYNLAPLVMLLSFFKGRKILFNGTQYTVIEKENNCKMFVDESGILSSSIETDRGDNLLEGEASFAYFHHEDRTVRFIRFASRRTKVLFNFYRTHPEFDYSLFQEEIGGILLPKLASDTVIDKTFEEKTKGYRSSIIYRLTYNDDLSLTMETSFSIRGVEVDKETFLTSGMDSTYDAFSEELARLGLEEESVYTDADRIAPALCGDFSNLARLCSLYLSDNLATAKVHKSTPIRANTVSGIDWFEVTYESDSLTAEQIQSILDAYRKKKKYIRIGKDYYSLDNEELAFMANKFKPKANDLTTEHLPIYQALRLNHDGKSMVNLSKQLTELFHTLNDYPSLELPLKQHFLDALRPYQLNGVRWLYSLATHHLAGILADDMGLGKSLELIAFLSLIEERGPTLIVSPKSLIYNWRSEFAKWDRSRDVYVIDGNKPERKRIFSEAKAKERPVIIASYDTLRNDLELFENLAYVAVILDEGQYIANAFALKSKAVKSLSAIYRFVLTGTPIQNSFLDLWSIFDFLLPGYLDSFNEFQNAFRGFESAHSEQGKKLDKMVAPFILRRKKDDVLSDLPPKTEEVTVIQFNDTERSIYSGYLANVVKQMRESPDDNRVQILAMLTRLRQICVDPSVFLEYNDVSTKLDYAISMIETAISGGHKVLIFSTFAEVLLHLEALLKERDIANRMIYGQTPAGKRLSYAEEFNNNPNLSVMLVSLKAGGTGLNLIGADIVIHLDPWWNVAAEEQATDRAHRIGQTRPVSVYKLICKDTVEEKVIELQNLKKELTTILHSEGEVGSKLTKEDILYLLS